METTNRRDSDARGSIRRSGGAILNALVVILAVVLPNAGFAPASALTDRHSMEYFRTEMRKTVRADHPFIVPVANAIRAVTRDPMQQLVMVNDVTHLLVDYDEDMRVYGVEDFHATLDEMIQRRRAGGWAYLRDDCDGRAVFAAHLLASLGIPWRFEASYWKEHAWVVARVNGRDYDLLDLRKGAPETDRIGYKVLGRFFVRRSNPPPYFDWRAAWAGRTNHNLKVGLALGMLTLDSTSLAMHTRHATDWSKEAPGQPLPPPDHKDALVAGVAGFPYGEPLFVGAIAAVGNGAGAPAVHGPATASNATQPAQAGTEPAPGM